MSNDIKIGINISDGGTGEKVNKVARNIKNTLEEAVIVAARIPAALAAAKLGVDNSNAMRSPTPAKATRAPTGINSDELKDYGTARGISGATGAASRDFAKQAQGLGGLVHVYATFAANLFAVTAAFSALSKAADTTNMVKGLDQLGAVSGKSLGSLAKQLSQVTDGAISMRDAMTATVSASAGGMTNAAILRMGVVAKQASQALGVAMPDALNRISRGITKLEPELLDEIGIMVRVDTASQAYARTLGKTASSLTDFEKRQGFANAVLEQGEKKFGAIKLDTNPYDRILASMQNIAQTGLELVNKVLGPLLNILSSSPTALATAMAGVAAVLLKQALPALGAWRENLSNLAIEAGKTSQRINTSFAEYQVAQSQKHGDEIEKRIQVEKAAAVKSLNIAKDATKVAGLSKGKVFDITQNVPKTLEAQTAAYKLLDSQIASNTTRGLNLAASDSKAAKAALDRAEALKALKAQLPELIKLENDLDIARAKAEASMHATPKLGSDTWAREKNAKDARLAAAKAEVLSNVGNNTQVMGVAGAWNQAKADIAEKGLKGLDATTTKLRAGMAIAASTVSTLASALMGAMMWVGLAIAGFGILNSWLTTNSKESEKFASSLTGLTDSVDNMSRTLDVIANKDPLAVFSADTIQARANALQGLSDSLKSLVKDFNEVQKASSWWDKGIDALWDAIGKGAADKLSTNIAKSITAGLAGAATSAAKSDAIAKLQSILGKDIDVTNFKQVNDELRKLSNPEIAAAGAAINKILNEVSLSANNAATNLASANTRLAEIGALVQAQNLALMPTDAIGKLGTSMLSAASDMSKALQDPINSMLVLNKVIDDSKTLSILSPNVAQDLISASGEIKELNESYGKLQQDLLKGEQALQKLKDDGKDQYKVGDLKRGANERVKVAEDTEAGALAKSAITQIQTAMKEAEAKMASAGAELSAKVANDFVNIGLAKLNTSLKAAMSEGAITAAKGYLAVLKEVGVGTADAEAKLAQQELGMQKQILDATYAQIVQQQRNTNALELSSVTNRILANTLTLTYARTQEAEDLAKKEREGLDKELKNVVDKVRLTEMKPSDALKLKAGGSISTEVLSGMAPYLSAITGYLSGLSKLGGQQEAQRIQQYANKQKEILGQDQKSNTARVAGIDTELQDINSAIALSAEYDKILATKKLTLEEEQRSLKFTNDALKYAMELKVIAEAKKGGKVSEAEIDKAVGAAQLDIATKAKKYASDTTKAKLDAYKEELKGIEETRQKEESKFNLIRTETKAITDIKLTQKSEEVKYLEEIGVLTAAEASRQQTNIALTQQAVLFENQRVEASSKYIASFIDLENKRLVSARVNEQAASTFKLQQDELTESYTRQITAQDLLNQGKITSIALAGQQDTLSKAQTEDMNKMVAATESLTSIFGELGTAIGGAGQALLKMSQDDEKYLTNKLNLEKQLAEAKKEKDSSKELSTQKALGELDKKQAKDEISNISKIAVASKKMFSEKTTAYKVLNGIEKAMAAFTLAMQVKEAAMDIKNFAIKMGLISQEVTAEVAKETAQFAARAASATADVSLTVSTEAAKNAAKTPGVFMSFLNWLGPWGMAAAGVAIAAVLGGGGGGATVNTAGLTAEDMQKSQGTGQKWVDGKLVSTGGGVLGDTEAKSNSIQNSLDMIAQNSIEGITYSGKSLSILESINAGIDELAITLYKTQGITTGSGFGTTEGATSSPGFLGAFASSSSTEIINAGIKFGGTLTNAVMTQVEDVLKKSSNSGFFGLFASSSEQLVNNIKALDTTTATAFGKVFNHMKDLFVEQGKDLGISAETITAVLATIPIEAQASLKGLKGKELREELGYVLSGIQDDLATKLFPALVKFQKFGEGMAETVTRINTEGKGLGIALENIGLSLKKVTEVAPTVSPELLSAQTLAKSKVTSLSEDLKTKLIPETVVNSNGDAGKQYTTRLIQDPALITKLATATTELTTANNAVLAVTGSMTTVNIEYQQSLIKALGGSDKYLETLSFFGESFRTEAQRLTATTNRITTAMSELSKPTDSAGLFAKKLFETVSDGGDGIVNTREEFGSLVTTLIDLTKSTDTVAATAALTLLPAIINLQTGFADMADAADAAAEKTSGFTERLLTAEGKGLEVVNMARAKELKGLSATDTAILKAVFAREDLNKTQDFNVRLMTTEGRSYEALQISRDKEIKGLSATDAAILSATFAREDLNKTEDLTIKLLTTQGKTVEAVALTRAREIKALSATDAALQKVIWGLEDAKTNAQKALSNLQKSVDAEKKSLGTRLANDKEAITAKYAAQAKANKAQIEAANKTAGSIRSIANALSQAVQQVVIENNEYSFRALQRARSLLTGATGVADLSQVVGIEDALSTASKDSKGFYGTFEEYAFDQGVTAGVIAQLDTKAQAQLSTAEAIVQGLEYQTTANQLLSEQEIAAAQKIYDDEIVRLDAVYELGESQLNALLGIDTSILSVSAAIAALDSALTSLASAQIAATQAAAAASNAAAAAASAKSTPAGGGGGGGSTTIGGFYSGEMRGGDFYGVGGAVAPTLTPEQNKAFSLFSQSITTGGTNSNGITEYDMTALGAYAKSAGMGFVSDLISGAGSGVYDYGTIFKAIASGGTRESPTNSLASLADTSRYYTPESAGGNAYGMTKQFTAAELAAIAGSGNIVSEGLSALKTLIDPIAVLTGPIKDFATYGGVATGSGITGQLLGYGTLTKDPITQQWQQTIDSLGSTVKGLGGTLGTEVTNALTDMDVRPVSASQTVIDMYSSLLNRAPDVEGGAVYQSILESGGSTQSVIDAIKASPEYKTINGSHALGLDYVPFDGYVAELHKGERVLTSAEAVQYTPGNNGTQTTSQNNVEIAAALRELASRLDTIEANTRATAGHTAGTDRKLARVVRNNAIATTNIPL